MADAKENATSKLQKVDEVSFDYDKLEAELDEDLKDLEGLKADELKIGNPQSLADAVSDAVWDQFMQQIGAVAGEDFIKENRGMTLDLRDSAHIQTTENFAGGKIATHNTEIDYRKRYDDWQSNFEKDKTGNIKMHKTRSGREEANLVKGARKPFDRDRPKGSAENHTDMDHTISAAEIIRDPAANAHMTKDEQIAFANSDANLNEMDAGQNRSKGDKPMTEWLDNSNSKGQKPNEIFDISAKKESELRQQDAKSRVEYGKRKKEGEQRSVAAGKKSQNEEAFRIGGKARQAAVMALLAQLGRNKKQKLVAWLIAKEKSISSFIQSVKEAVQDFVHNLKQNILAAGSAVASTLIASIFGPLANMINRVISFVKQGIRSVKEAIQYFRNPENRKKSFSVQILEVSKIVMAGLTAAGAIALGEVIEKNLLLIPGFAVAIPLIGSLASIIGMFLGAVVAGIAGAAVLHLIDKLIAKKLKAENMKQQIDKNNHVLGIQGRQIAILEAKLQDEKQRAEDETRKCHQATVEVVKASVQNIFSAEQDIDSTGQKIRENGQQMNTASQETQEGQLDNASKIKKINEMLDSL